jgi:hypothetical protein
MNIMRAKVVGVVLIVSIQLIVLYRVFDREPRRSPR